MAECIGVFQGAEFDCEDQLQAGVEPLITVINSDDILSFPKTDGTISDIILKPGKKGFVFQGTRNSVVPEMTNKVSGFSNRYSHKVQYQVFDVSQLQKNNLNGLANKAHVIIVYNRSRTEEQAAFEVYGEGVGLELPDGGLIRLPGDQATGGSFTVISQTADDGAQEEALPRTFWDTDYATTLAKIQDLSNLPSISNVTPIAVATAGGTAVVITGNNFFLNATDDVQQVDWVDTLDAVTNEPGFVTDSNTQITIASSVALIAGTYKLRVTTTSGIAESELIIVAS